MMRVREIVRGWLWAKAQQRVWQSATARDQLAQIIWRLRMNQSTPDNRAAMHVALELMKTLGRPMKK